MTDAEKREKVMKELSWLISNFPLQKSPIDAADRMCNAINVYCNDALALLRELDQGIEPEISRKSVTETTVSLWYKCGACGGAIEQGDDEFCRHCGKKVKWYD